MPKPQGPAHTDPKDLQSHLHRSLGQSMVALSGFICISFAFRGGLENQEFLYQECLLRIYHVKRTPEVNELRTHRVRETQDLGCKDKLSRDHLPAGGIVKALGKAALQHCP